MFCNRMPEKSTPDKIVNPRRDETVVIFHLDKSYMVIKF